MNNKPYHYTYREHVLRLAALVGELASMAGEPVEFQAILRHLDELDDHAAMLRQQVEQRRLHYRLGQMMLSNDEMRRRVEQEGLF